MKRKIKYYLAGPIADVKDDSYKAWRDDITKFLENIGQGVYNPLTKYEGKAGDFKDELLEMRENGEWKEVKKFMEDLVLPADRLLVKKSDGVIAFVPNYTVGTLREISLAYEWKKPVYIVSNMKLPSNSLIGMATEIFKTFEELKKYLKEIN